MKSEWGKGVIGTDLNGILIRLKRMKAHMKNLNWKNGDLFEKVKKLKNELQNVQKQIDGQPFDKELRRKWA